jgi:CheY-like chemotaxis protein/two-component sensor histidine kinase
MSHELRTPLNGILGFAQFLRQDTIPEDKRKQYVDIIFHNGKHLLKIINNVIDVAKIDAGEIFIKKETCDLNGVLDKIEKEISQQIQQKGKSGINLYKEVEIQQNFELSTDSARLEQIFDNLLSNALKFTSKGEIRFGFKIHGTDNLLFYVSDTGIGIPKDKHEVIFQRFRQADDSLTRKFGGIGLGLTIAKGLIELLGGDIWFESTLEKGTTFYFSLPLSSNSASKENTQLSENWKNKKILIVEDENISYLFLQTIFKEQYVEVERAGDGKEAIQMATSNDYKVILMDIRLPGIDGLTATRSIKKEKPNTTIIALTAYTYDNNEQNSKSAGCDYYLTKPINKQSLFEILNSLD